MASEFTLSKREALPNAVMVNGSAFLVNTDFRDILLIFRLNRDDALFESHKVKLTCERFYKTAPKDTDAAIKGFQWFVRCGDMSEVEPDGKPPVFDYDQDAGEVYASFVALYGIDLLTAKMHWWQFSALLDGAFRCESAISEKVRLRSLDASKCADPAAVRKAQESIQIETYITREERRLRKQLNDVLTGGGDVSAALEALKSGL